jgi:hypothetical protein
MCMMCEEEFMYQAYLNYLAGKAQAGTLAPEEKAFLEASGYASATAAPAPSADGFSCEPAPDGDAADANSLSRLRPKAS